MISSIFYFADTEQEYLDNFNRRQVKPYTIVFCRDTHSLWKNGIKYGGDSAEVDRQIEESLERDVQPLIDQLHTAIEEANRAAELAHARLDNAISEGAQNLQDLQNTVDEEKNRLSGIINNLSTNIQDRIQDMFLDSDWIEQNWPQGVTAWQSGWDESIDAYLTEVGYWDVDTNGNKVTKWSKLQQQADSIRLSVNQITEEGGKLDILKSGLEQQITDEGNTRNELFSQQAEVNADTGEILKWMYSGLTTESGKNKTLADLSAMAKDGSTTGISTIGALVEKIPETDPNTGNPLTDNEGNIIYKKDNNGNYLYRSKASLSAALNNSLATMINEATDNSASSEIVTSVGDYIAGIKSQADATQSQIALLAGNENGDFSQILLKDDLETAIGQIATKKGVGSGDVFTSVKKLEDGGYVSESGLDARVNDAISSFTVLATEHSAGGTLVSKLREDSEDMALLRTEVDEAKGAYTTLAAKFNGSEAGVVAQVDDKLVHAGLVSKNQDGSYTSSVYTKVLTDGAILSATAGLVAEDKLTGKVAGVLATVGKEGSEITLDADQLNITSDFINAMNALLNVGSVTTELILAALAEGLTIKADKVNFQKADGSPAPISIDVNDGTLVAENAKITGGIFVDKVDILNTPSFNTDTLRGLNVYYDFFEVTKGTNLYDNYYDAGSISLKTNHLFIYSEGLRNRTAASSYNNNIMYLSLPPAHHFVGLSIVITNESYGFADEEVILMVEYLHEFANNDVVCMTNNKFIMADSNYEYGEGLGLIDGAPYILNASETSNGRGKTLADGEVLASGIWQLYEKSSGKKSYKVANEIEMGSYAWLELTAVNGEWLNWYSVLPNTVRPYNAVWMITRWEKKRKDVVL